MDDFKETFKYYKQKRDHNLLTDVINFELQNASECVISNQEFMQRVENNNCVSCIQLGLLPHQKWQIYTVENLKGFYFIKNPFTAKGQQYWIRKCIELYPRKPSITNLDLHDKSIDDIWSLQKDPDPAKRKLIHKLSWATFGYHHNWDTKVYDPGNYSRFPTCLADLAKHIASYFCVETFNPEAAIVNYYNNKSSLGIHNDHSEMELEKPILSISFGLTAIFLIGTKSKAEKPNAILLRSGDIVILSGASRLSYHAVPAIIQENRCPAMDEDTDETWSDFHTYIKTHRINISVRQVYPDTVES